MALFSIPRQPETKDAQTALRTSGLAQQAFGRPYAPATAAGADPNRWIEQVLSRVSWLFRGVYKIADHAARLPVEVLDGDPIEGTPITDHELVPILNYKASVNERSGPFRHRVMSTLLLSPRGVFIERIPSNGGGLAGLAMLPPGNTKAIPDRKDFIAGAEVRTSSSRWIVPKERLLWIRIPHPSDPYRSACPVEALGLPIDSDYLAALYSLNFLRNDGRPGGLLSVKGGMLPQDMDELRALFQGGAMRAGEWRVIESDGFDAKDMATTPRDAQYVELRGMTKTEILAGIGVPPTVLGDTAGRTFDNADVDREVFWQETMVPYLDLLADAWDELDGDPNTFVRYRLDGVEALQRAEYRRREELRSEVSAQTISVDEYRIATGREPVGADALYVGMGLTEIARTKVAQAAAERDPIVVQTEAGLPSGQTKAQEGPQGALGADPAKFPPVTN